MNLDEDYLFEHERYSSSGDSDYFFGYLRDSSGKFVQVSIISHKIVELTKAVANQNIIKIVINSSDSVISVIIFDTNLNELDKSEGANLVINDKNSSYYLDAINNKERTSRIGYSMNRELNVLEIISPIIEDGEVVLLLSTLYTLEPYVQVRDQIRIIVVVLSLVIIVTSYLFIFFYVIIPLRALESSIASFDPITSYYDKPKRKYLIYNETFDALDSLSLHIDKSNLEREKLHNDIYQQSIQDFLTKLPNRRKLISTINHKMETDVEFSLLFIDIDNFKNINDSKGHVIGDMILREISSKLKHVCKGPSFVSRYGGDEFIIIIDTTDNNYIEKFFKSLYSSFSQPVNINNELIYINLSIGISKYPENGNTSTELIRKADLAIYESKLNGKNQYAYYHEEMDLVLKEEVMIKNVLQDSLRDDGFKILLQPQVNIDTNEIVSYEALARLKNGNIGPNKFIPVAEKYGLIDDIGRVITGKVMYFLKEMKDLNIPLKKIYVNFSASQLRRREIPVDMNNKMLELGISNKYIGVEITESVLIDEEDHVKDFFDALRDFGFTIAIDDFGSGNASLNYLTNYPLELVKLDHGFSQLYLNEENFDIYESIILLANKLKYNVLAEGIEEEREIELLKKTDCKLVQGYYYFKPLELDEVIKINKR